MKRLIILNIILLSLFSCKEKELPRPNILWLTFEDTSPHYIGCYGNKNARTPVMDQLAAEGLRFTSAFSTGTVCSPSRYALITATSPMQYGTGHHRSRYDVPEFINAFPQYLKEAGYYTSNNSKTDYNTAKAKEFIQNGWHESSNQAGWWKRKKGQPFFAVFNCMHSHQSRVMTNPWWKYEEQILNHLALGDIIQENEFDMPPTLYDSPEMRKEHSRIYNGIQLTDKFFGEILDKLDKDGLRDSTIIFCYSDHGEGITGGKTFSRAMGYQVPLIIWIPEMYKDLSPWGSGGIVVDDVVNFTDLSARVLKLAGIEIPDYVEGIPFMGKNTTPSRKYTFGGLNRTGENLTLSRSITDGTYIYTHHFMPFQSEIRWQKYFDFARLNDLMREDYKNKRLNKNQATYFELQPAETLFNIKKDPWEINNLTKQENYFTQQANLREKLKAELISKRDAHFIPEYSHQKSGTSPYQLSRDNDFYPAKRAIETAFWAGNKEKLSSLLEAINDENKIVRYWAAVGLYTHCANFGPFEEIQRLKDDTYPPADIFIQGIRAFYNNEEKAASKLIDYLSYHSKPLNLLSGQLYLLQDTITPAMYEQFLETTLASKDEETHQLGELMEYKHKNKALEYKFFW